jgi:hypothetical protein
VSFYGKEESMFAITRACGPALFAGLALCACTSSGPTWSSYTLLGDANGPSGHEVTCFGLLENRHACENEAQRLCPGQTVTTLQSMAPLGRTLDGTPDSRVMLLQCGTPQAALGPVTSPEPVTTVKVRSAPAPRVHVQALPAPVNNE